jgi:hypothetical protein
LTPNREACQKILNEGIECIISSSIKNEALKLTEEAYRVLNICLRHYMKPALERNNVTRVIRNEAVSVANVFLQQKKRIKQEVPTRSSIRDEMFGIIENYVAKLIHELAPDKSISVDDLLANTLSQLNTARYEIEKPFKSLRVVPVEPDEELLKFAPIVELVKNKKDIEHLMSAVTHQFQRNAWVIFVTNDEKEILANADEIWDICGLRCTKPNWALDYYRDITKLKRPRQHFQDVLMPSSNQRDFVRLVENVLNLQIRSKVF